jgi:enoyl-CoA hydratase/carnithine racemase
MFTGLIEAGLQLSTEPGVRAAVLSGEGRAFCAGLDFSSFAAMSKAGGENEGGESGAARGLLGKAGDSPANRAQRAAWIWQEVPVPVIAAVHGVAYGGGLQIALGADMRYVRADAKLSIMEIKWGLVPDMSGTQTLRRLVRLDVAKELTFTGRIVSGEEAVGLGLATRVTDDPHADALEVAREIATKSPDAIRRAKRLFNESGLGTVRDGLALEARMQSELLGSPNQTEAVRANVEKRAPEFSDPG